MTRAAENIQELIENSTLPYHQKLLAKGFVERADGDLGEFSEVVKLITDVAHEKSVKDIILSTDEVKIYTVPSLDVFDMTNPYRAIYLKDDQWVRCYQVSPTFDRMMLIYLGEKHGGLNSQFCNFAEKMLDIDSPK